MRVLIAFDKFKDSLTAEAACRAAREAIAASRPHWRIETAPLADGGDGFCAALADVTPDSQLRSCRVLGPQGDPVNAAFALVSTDSIPAPARALLDFPERVERVAIIEMAQSSGISLVPQRERSPWTTTTAGLGEMLGMAKANGAQGAIIGLGGSATHDLALGALQKLGFVFLKNDQRRFLVPVTPSIWPEVGEIVPPEANPLGEDFVLRIACDVENPLLGPNGAAAVFGPQKGLIPFDYDRLESLTDATARRLLKLCGKPESLLADPGAGAAGGTGFGLIAAFGGSYVSGFQLVESWIGLEEKLARSDIVITGEGRFDASSFQGKGPGSLVKKALEANKKAYVFAGSLSDDAPAQAPRCAMKQITAPGTPLAEALRTADANLRAQVSEVFC